MDTCEATKMVMSRIQNMDPENASKIMGYILIQDQGEKEMIRLACGPENLLLSVIKQAKVFLELSSSTSSTPSTPPSPLPLNPFSSNPCIRPTSFPQSSPRIIIPNNNGFHHHINPSSPSSPWSSVSGFSEHRSSPSSHLMSPRPGPASSLSYAAVVNGTTNGTSGSFSSASSFSLPFYTSNNNTFSSDLSDEYSNLQVQDQLSFLDDESKNVDFMDPIISPGGRSDSILFPYGNGTNTGVNWVESVGNCGDAHHHHLHRRSCSVSDVFLSGGGSTNRVSEDVVGSAGGWRPCVYFARGYCKNGSSCKFLHVGGFADSPDSAFEFDGLESLLRMKAIQQQRFAAMAGSPFPCNQRSAAAALMMGEELHKFGRCRPERNDFPTMGLGGNANSSSRQIYLTFPADSTFKEEDVSNYFSIFGPVQDVRIPYQQKRMFGFVTFVYPDTVKQILAKGNPHFVCDSRVLVKPYKEKGKVPDKKQQQQQIERGELSACLSPTGLDSVEPFDHIPFRARMFYNAQDVMWRRKFEEQFELQQAIEYQDRRLMNFQLTDLKSHYHNHQLHRNLSIGAAIPSPTQSHSLVNQSQLLPLDGVTEEVVPGESNGGQDALDPTDLKVSSEIYQVCSNDSNETGGNGNNNAKEESSNLEDSYLHESNLEHILPDTLFASPTKSDTDCHFILSTTLTEADDSVPLASMLLSSSSSLPVSSNNIHAVPDPPSSMNMASQSSCFLQMPRFFCGQEATEM